MVVHCVRTNGGSCPEMADPSKRAFLTEHGKELTLYPEEMGLKGGIGSLIMSDTDGIRLNSDGVVQIIGADVRFEAPVVTCSAPQGELIIAKSDAALQEVESSFSMSSAYQVLSDRDTAMEGSDLEPFEPYEDQPLEGKFDWGKLLGNVLAGLAVVAVVALTVGAIVATGGLAAVGIAAGQFLGSSCKVLAKLGVLAKFIPQIAKVTETIMISMFGFDIVSLIGGLLFPGNSLMDLNQKLHSNSFYNGFQLAVSLVAVFTGGINRGMRLGETPQNNRVKDGVKKPGTEGDSGAGEGGSGTPQGNNEPYIPRDADGNPIPLAKQRVNGQDIPLPDPEATGPHTVLGGKVSSETGEIYRQSATFPQGTWPPANGENVPWSEVHWTNHGRGDHPNPHQHIFEYNPDKGGWIRGGPSHFED